MSAEKEGSQAPLAKRSTTSSASNDPSSSLERKPRARLEKEKPLAPDAREERQGGGVGRDLERVARGLERRVALLEELLHLGPFAHESTRERHEGRLVGGVCRVDDGHGSAEEPAERRRERLEESLSPVRGHERGDRRPVRRLRETGRGFRDERPRRRRRPGAFRRATCLPRGRTASGPTSTGPSGPGRTSRVTSTRSWSSDAHQKRGPGGRALGHEVRRELFRRERLHESEERAPEEARLLAGEDRGSLAARERREPRVGAGATRFAAGTRRGPRALSRDRLEVRPVRKKGRDVRRARREAAREGGDPGNVRERNRRHAPSRRGLSPRPSRRGESGAATSAGRTASRRSSRRPHAP